MKDEFARMCAAMLEQRAEDLFASALGVTSAAPPEQKPLTLDSLRRMCVDLDARRRRTSFTLIVEEPHVGAMLLTRYPSEGTRVECSYAQAAELHKQWPMRLDKILSIDSAEFVPIAMLPGIPFALSDLPAPPYELRDDDHFDQKA